MLVGGSAGGSDGIVVRLSESPSLESWGKETRSREQREKYMMVEGETEEVGRTAVGFMEYRRVPSRTKSNATPAPINIREPGYLMMSRKLVVPH